MSGPQKFAVTVGLKGGPALHDQAVRWARELDLPYLKRRGRSLESLRREAGVTAVLVATARGPQVDSDEGTLRYHPCMAVLRTQEIVRGHGDHFASACALGPGSRILDCTLGMGADAIVESFGAGETGEVIAIEKNPVVAALIAHGMKTDEGEHPTTVAAMRRVRVVCADYLDFLRGQPDNSFDAVYFDPMFRHPFTESAGIHPLRFLADPLPVSSEAIQEARRVARHRVVLKESSKSEEFARLGFTEFEGGKYSNVRYGVMRMEK